jgi:ketosteroid isomerase-like protein
MKYLITITFLSFLLLTSCKRGPEKAENISESNVSISKRVFEHFNKHEWAKMAALYSDTAEFKDPALGPEVVKQSRRQVIEKYSGMGKMFPDIRDEVINIYPSGDKNVIVEFVSSGSAPDSTKWSLPICTIFTIENGLITKDYTYYDTQQ